MQPDFLDRYSRSDSVVHRRSARLKLSSAAVLLLVVGLTPPSLLPLSEEVPISLVHLAAVGLTAVVVQLAGLPWGYMAWRVAGMTPVVLMMALSIPASRGLESGWALAASVLVKGLASFAVVLTLVNVAPFQELLAAMGSLGVPRLFTATLGFMYRYQFVLIDELRRMSQARQARSFRRRRGADYVDAANLIGPVLLRSFERGERVHRAMLARGFNGQYRSLDD